MIRIKKEHHKWFRINYETGEKTLIREEEREKIITSYPYRIVKIGSVPYAVFEGGLLVRYTDEYKLTVEDMTVEHYSYVVA